MTMTLSLCIFNSALKSFILKDDVIVIRNIACVWTRWSQAWLFLELNIFWTAIVDIIFNWLLLRSAYFSKGITLPRLQWVISRMTSLPWSILWLFINIFLRKLCPGSGLIFFFPVTASWQKKRFVLTLQHKQNKH